MNNKNKGFTLIELMITVSIICIVSAVALPAYQDYTIRAQVVEGLSLASGMKANVQEFYGENGRLNTLSEAQAIRAIHGDPVGNYVEKVTLAGDGVLIIQYGNKVNTKISGLRLNMSPLVTPAGNLKWVCIGTSFPKQYLPSSCITKASEIPY